MFPSRKPKITAFPVSLLGSFSLRLFMKYPLAVRRHDYGRQQRPDDEADDGGDSYGASYVYKYHSSVLFCSVLCSRFLAD